MAAGLETREGIDAYMEEDLKRYAEILAESGKVRPQAALFITRTPDGEKLPEIGILVVLYDGDDFGPGDKDRFSKAITVLAKKTYAVGVVFVSEAWMLMGIEKPPKGSFEKVPGRLEVLFVTLDHLAYSNTQSWYGTIERDKEDRPTVTGWARAPSESKQEGRFVDLIDRERFA